MKKALPILAIIIIVFGISYIYTNITKDNADNAKVSNDKLNISLYFTNSEKSNLLIEERQIDKVKDNQIVRIVVEELIRGPESQELNATLSPETRLLSVKTEGTVSVVNFSKEFLDFENTADEIIARFSVVNTLCDIKNINKVKILVEENEILDKEGNPVGIIGKDDIVFEARTDKGNMDIKLYFVGSDGEYLVPEIRNINIKDYSIERYIIEELIKGPEDASLSMTIPSEVKLINIETKEGICFVNFSEDLITKHWGGTAGEIFTIYSIVNSLTELDYIDKVQFLIEGKKQETFTHMIFNEPFERDESLIKEII